MTLTDPNLKNYDRFDIPETEKKIIGDIKGKASTEEIYFTNNPQNVLNIGRVSRHCWFCWFEECCI